MNTPATKRKMETHSICLVRERGASHFLNRGYDAAVFAELLEPLDREHLYVLCLDSKNKVIGIHQVSIGSLNASLVHPREVFKAAILHSSASIIVLHNHPSGSLTHSQDDIEMAARLIECGHLLGVAVLDSIVTGQDREFSSLRETMPAIFRKGD